MQQSPGTTLVALGGNALKSGEGLLEYPALPAACSSMAAYLAADEGRRLIVTHGNGPQIGLLAADMSASSYRPLDVLGAETEGMLGYLIEQELARHLGEDSALATVLTRTEIDAEDPDALKPVKPVGDWIDRDSAAKLEKSRHWQFTERDGRFRRIVPSPRPVRTLQIEAIRTLCASGTTVICAGGGGIPVALGSDGNYQPVEAVVDKDYTSALLGIELQAELLILATGTGGVYRNWEQPGQELITETTPAELAGLELEAGSMRPKVEAACDFVRKTGGTAVIGALERLEALLGQSEGTRIRPDGNEEHR